MEDSFNDSPSSDFLRTDGGKTELNAIEIPSISLPKGGGAIRGIDEKFSVNAVNGTSSFSIPLPFSPARGASPSLGLTYSSGAGNGVFGLGWDIGLSSIQRKTTGELPQYLDAVESDTFIFSDAEDLVPEFKKRDDGSFEMDTDDNYIINEKDSLNGLFTIRYYRPRIEGLFARIERWATKSNGRIKWKVTGKDNTTTYFGWTDNAVISNPNNSFRIWKWLPEFVFDDKGNCSRYIYKKEDDTGLDNTLINHKNRFNDGKITYTNSYLEKVLYGNLTPYSLGDTLPIETDYLFQTVFDYGTLLPKDSPEKVNDWDFRPDAFSDYRAGFELRTTRLCKRVLLFHVFEELAQKPDQSDKKTLVSSINFEYDTYTEEDFTFLKSITSHGYIKKADGSYSEKQLPPISFEYQQHDWNSEIKSISPEDLVHAPVGPNHQQYQFTDLFNEGLSGMLTEQSNGWYYKHNLGNGSFGSAKLISPKPSVTGLGSMLQLTDLDADGGKQLVNLKAEPKGYFELDDDDKWSGIHLFNTLPNIRFDDANTRMLDLDGDGRPDVLISEDEVFTWYESEGRRGFSEARKTRKPYDEEIGPRVVFSEAGQSIFLADMSGDGMTDILRIRNGEVCYWPNLGYGNFGAKVSMGNAPFFDHPGAFNPSYLRLADIDGSGTADIIYLGKNKFSCWKNLSGNQFGTTPFEITSFPKIHAQANVTIVDLLGNGVPCIVWSSSLTKNANAPLRYIDLMNSKKPHIMVKYQNNMGKEVSMEYTPSTQFYIHDKMEGRPWVTKLHFPVHCVSKIISEDKISGTRFCSEYKYHHGYFDHSEREFRGFGMVEKKDTETFEHWVKSGASNVTEATLHQEPVITKTWSHTGAFLQKDKILAQFAKDYWYEEMERRGFSVSQNEKELLEASIITSEGMDFSLIDHLSSEEWRQAHRACKGMMLRTEIFAQDAIKYGNTDEAHRKELTPYTVATHNCTIELLQPKGNNKHAVFIVMESEAIEYSYERDQNDPRVAHTLNIKHDRYGNVLESVTVVYPRSVIDDSLPMETQMEQGKTLIKYSQNQFTNDVISDDVYRLRTPSEAKSFQLKGVSKVDDYYSPADFIDILSDANSDTALYHEIDKPRTPNKAQRRLIEHVRSTYYSDDLLTALPLHKLGSLGVPFESYQLAYTPELIADIFGTKVNETMLVEGKYTHSEGDDNWWVRSGTTQYRLNGESLDEVKARFYNPFSYTDAYGAMTKVKYYGDYHLFVEETEDALGNKVNMDVFNFRALSPQRIRDINNNITEGIVDELGFVKATAVFGKGNEADDLVGLTEITDLNEQNDIISFFDIALSTDLESKGKALLKHATSRFVYDLDAYRTKGKPIVVAAIQREEHFQKNQNSAIQMSFEYTNGMGGVVMIKVQAESGMGKKVTVEKDGTYTITDCDTEAVSPKQFRWIGNGRTVLNNKGNPVKQYEPYFSVSRQYENINELVETGQSSIQYYDTVGRLTRTVMPDETFTKVEFGAWKQIGYDANDTILESDWYVKRANRLIDSQLMSEGKDPEKEKSAADKAAVHANTPAVIHFDTLARPILSVEHNKNPLTNQDEFYYTKAVLDIESNLRCVYDARELPENNHLGNKVMEFKYDMLGNMVYQNSMDGGQRWPFGNILSKPQRTWDERGHEFQYFYDVLQRPTMAKVVGGDGEAPLDHIFDRSFYGESQNNAEAKNLRGRIFKHYDTGGLVHIPEYDFAGSPVSTTRKLFCKYKEVANWIDANLKSELENEAFTVSSNSDALGRVLEHTNPDGSTIIMGYNKRGLPTQKKVAHLNPAKTDTYIKDIRYNEKGLREKIFYGNDVSVTLYYDSISKRIKRLLSKKKNNDSLQDWRYTFDPIGNITHIEDTCASITFFGNQKVKGVNEYTYDALYRLVEASGRENDTALNFSKKDNWNDEAFIQDLNPNDPMAMRNYVQQFKYDQVGNILEMKHMASGNNWVRHLEYEKLSNRLSSTQIGAQTYNYVYQQEHGFITRMPHLEEMGWNFKEELVKSVRQKVKPENGTAETTYYQYDGTGTRIRKVTENSAGKGIIPTKKDERIYVGGFESYKTYKANQVNFERQSLSLLDEGYRFAMVETITTNTDYNAPKDELVGTRLVRYQLHNHVGSSALELDETAHIISYEEYHPFGTTAYQARNSTIKAAAKRYRYTGMERDDETGLEYHSARYYLPWLGRWLSVDPIGIHGGINDFAYCVNNPINKTDPSGKKWCWNVFADDCSLDTVRIFGGVKMVGGVLEAAAGIGLTIASAPACTSVAGCVVPAAGITVAVHGLDTAVSGSMSLVNGQEVDTLTSRNIQAAGMERDTANLADATIGIVGSMGSSAMTKVPMGAAPGIDKTVPSITVSHEAAAPTAGNLLHPSAWVAGHTRIGVTMGNGTPTIWTHLIASSADEAGIITSRGMAPRFASTATIRVSAAEAEAAANAAWRSAPMTLTQARNAGASGELLQAMSRHATFGDAGRYSLLGNNCTQYGTRILETAGIRISATSPAKLLASASVRSERPVASLLSQAPIVQPLGAGGAAFNLAVGTRAAASIPETVQERVSAKATSLNMEVPSTIQHAADALASETASNVNEPGMAQNLYQGFYNLYN